MSKMFSALHIGKQLAGNAVRKITTFYGGSSNGNKKVTSRFIHCFAKYTSTWNKPMKFYSQDSRHTPPPSVQLISDKKTKKYKLVEKPIVLTAEQIKALFYKKMKEPIALISQDKYYTYLKEPSKSEPKDDQVNNMVKSMPIQSTMLEVEVPKSSFPNAEVLEKIPTKSMESETFVKIPSAYDFPEKNKVLLNTPKVIDSILEKELGENTIKFQDIKREEQAAKNSWKSIKYAFFVIGTSIIGVIVGAIMYIGAPNMGEDEDDIYSEMPVALQYVYRTVDEFQNFNKLIKDPSREKLLPDILKPPYYQPPYTLVLEFTDILVHPEWTYSTGWRFKKRPGLDQFLEALYARYEVVVYTAEMGMTVFPIIEALDRNNLISYKLVRDATKFMDGHHVKDLDKLNRDLSKVIVIDWNPESTKLHEDNLFRIPRWKGNDDDTALFDLTALLIAISEWKVEDVRSVLKYYSGFEDPLASFRERQKLLAAQGL